MATKLALRLGMSVAYVGAALFSPPLPFYPPDAAAIWHTIIGVCLAFTAVLFTGRSTVFVGGVTFLVGALIPFLILCRIGMAWHPTFAMSCDSVVTSMQNHNTLGAFQLVVPTVVAMIAAWLIGRSSQFNPART